MAQEGWSDRAPPLLPVGLKLGLAPGEREQVVGWAGSR